MAASLLIVVGHCTSTTARVLVCARTKHAVVRIAGRADGRATRSVRSATGRPRSATHRPLQQ